jgi:hypothetical protein
MAVIDDLSVADLRKLMPHLMAENERLRSALVQFVAVCDTAPPIGLIRELGLARKTAGAALGLKK